MAAKKKTTKPAKRKATKKTPEYKPRPAGQTGCSTLARNGAIRTGFTPGESW